MRTHDKALNKGGKSSNQKARKLNHPRATINLRKRTKDKLDKCRAPGQCYDGFICQLVDLWEKAHRGAAGN